MSNQMCVCVWGGLFQPDGQSGVWLVWHFGGPAQDGTLDGHSSGAGRPGTEGMQMCLEPRGGICLPWGWDGDGEAEQLGRGEHLACLLLTSDPTSPARPRNCLQTFQSAF